jgi:hypothetical protein
VQHFVEHPVSFLIDVVRSLDKESKAAIAMIFMSGGNLPSPIDFTSNMVEALTLLGGTLSGVRIALNSLNGSLVKLTKSSGTLNWTYKHPTIGDAFAAVVADDPELLEIYLAGARIEELISEVVCGDVEIEGAQVSIPARFYDRFAAKPGNINKKPLFTFLATRCDSKFLEVYAASSRTLWEQMSQFWTQPSGSPEIVLAAKLQGFALLPPSVKNEIKNRVIELSVELPDATFLDKRAMHGLFSNEETDELLKHVRDQLMPQLDEVVGDYDDNYDRREHDPYDYYGFLIDTLETLHDRLQGDKEVADNLTQALNHAYSRRDTAMENQASEPQRDYDTYDSSSSGSTPADSSRSIFDDIDQ